MTPEQAIEYLDTLGRRHGLDGLTKQQRTFWIAGLHRHPETINDFIRRAELNIEQAAADKEAA